MNIFYKIVKLIDFILSPEKCLRCNTGNNIICKECINNIPKPENDLPDNIYALYEYRHPVIKKLLTDAKYRKKFGNLKVFGPYLASSLLDIINEYTELTYYKRILIIPVPISKKRYKERGFNQAKIIAQSIIQNIKENNAINNIYLADNIVKKIKDTTPQASIHNKYQRLKSPKGTFSTNIKNENNINLENCLCIIIDDISTTGGTINEMRRILIKSGAEKVIGLTIAH